MSLVEWNQALARSFEDRRLSRGEKQDLAELVATLKSRADRDSARHSAFELVRQLSDVSLDRSALDWLEEVVKTIKEESPAQSTLASPEVYFSPGDECPRAIIRTLSVARKSTDICVFTITDDRLAEAILETAHRGVAVRIITDNEKAEDLGSDIERFERARIPVCVDRSPFHMHHKFAIVDQVTLINGSYNWTRGAARDNEENLVILHDPRLISMFQATFDRLWKTFSK